jgi:formamidopyrimidine-DNA glycosylase
MPELPEVETVRRGLAPLMEGHVIARAEVRRPDLRWPLPDRMAERLTGQRVEGLRRRSKYILADLSGGEVLLIHLGMSGRMLIAPAGEGAAMVGDHVHQTGTPAKHDHIELTMASGARITFNDPRRFGMWDLFTGLHPLLDGIGPEPFSNAFSPAWLAARLAGRRTPVKAALLDQANVAGLGNIYVCEVLFRARIHPATLAGALTAAQVGALVTLIREVLAEAIEAGGSSLRDYRQADGELGYFQHTFRVYGREDAPCPACGTPVARIVQSGRSSFFCPACQR